MPPRFCNKDQSYESPNFKFFSCLKFYLQHTLENLPPAENQKGVFYREGGGALITMVSERQ